MFSMGKNRVKIKENGRKSAGYSLVEVLVTTAVLVILMALTFVAIFAYKKRLDITELDNAAREIYMAAQNRAVLLKNRDRLEELVEKKEDPENPNRYTNQLDADSSAEKYYVSKKEIKEMKDQELLPAESIEPSLWSGDFYIVYEPESGSVTDVFYVEKEFSEGEFGQTFYDENRKKSREDRMNMTPMVGYYGGASSEAGDTYTPRTPMLRIINDNELTVEVTCWLPVELVEVGGDGSEAKNVQLLLNLQYGDQSIDLCEVTLSNYGSTIPSPVGGLEGDFALESNARFDSREGVRDVDTALDHPYYKYVCTYVLDSLEQGRQFKDLGELTTEGYWTTPLGRDFTVTAEIKYKGSSRLISAVKRTATDNSLFATSTLGDTAHIACMRHLQNLHPGFSGVDTDLSTDTLMEYDEERLLEGSEELKRFAWQIADIDNITVKKADGTEGPYNFSPIDNDNIVFYDGHNHAIRNLYIDIGKNEYFGANHYYEAGLFAEFNQGDIYNEGGGDGDLNNRGLQNIRLVNAIVRSNNVAGVLSGIATNALIKNCQVYWESPYVEGMLPKSDLRQYLGSTSYNDGYALSMGGDGEGYKVTGIYVGGLVGYSLTECHIEDCFVSTTLKGNFVGGLVGQAMVLTIHNSYADCYLAGDELYGSASVSGLVGNLTMNGTCEFVNCYAAGYISMENVSSSSKCYGLFECNESGFGDQPPTVKNCYVAMAYSKPKDITELANRYPITEDTDFIKTGVSNNCWYLYSPYVNNDLYPERMLSYDQLIDESQWASLFDNTAGTFEKKSLNVPDPSGEGGGVFYTHPYNLQDGIELENYPFPAFGDSMPQYGDWPEANQKGYLVYWERYNDGTAGAGSIGVKGADDEVSDLPSDLPKLKGATDTNALVVNDGYAVYLPSDLVPKDDSSTITIRFERSYKTSGGTENEVAEMTYGLAMSAPHGLIQVTSGATTYYLAPLPKEWLVGPDGGASVASSDFYQKLHITVENSANPTTYFFNPHFASTAIKADYADTSPTASASNINTVSVRSPRHLYELSRHQEYYHNSVANQYTYKQELDLDYSVYTGYDLFTAAGGTVSQEPIGKEGSDSTFNQIYDGGCHTIVKVCPQTSGRDVGLFGKNEGIIRNVVFLGNGVGVIDREKTVGNPALMVITGTATSLNIGTLVGHNAGTITNCAVAYVALSIEANGTEEVNCGGLVGKNDGTILNSAATLDYISVAGNGSKYVGGFVGSNGSDTPSTATITSCYAIGRMNVAEGTTGINVGGFAGANSGTLQRSYTAYDLTSYGASSAFCPNGTTVENCYYLNNGSFTYLNNKEVFSANYPAGAGTSQTWTELTAEDNTSTMSKLNGAGGGFEMHGAKYGFPGVEYVFPAVVKKAGDYIHYGDWPEKVKDGLVGLFYWEKEEKQLEGKEEYHVSAIVINPNESTVRKVSNLCTDHSDGGVIKEYGYGYFYDNNLSGTVTCAVDNLGIKGANVTSLQEGTIDPTPIKDSFISVVKNVGIDIEGSDYAFNAYQTINLNPTTDTDIHWMYLINGATSSTWTLRVNADAGAGVDEKNYKFNVNPFFGESLSLATIEETAGLNDDTGSSVLRGPLGTDSIPFETRSVEQLQYINWNHVARNTNTVAINGMVRHVESQKTLWGSFPEGYIGKGATNNKNFTFLNYRSPEYGDTYRANLLDQSWSYINSYSARNNDYCWKQTHDINGMTKMFTPIAAFQDEYLNDDEGTWLNKTVKIPLLTSWFGGSYDGDSYMIKDLRIDGGDSDYVGLFGITRNASLKNIVLCASNDTYNTGASTITARDSAEAVGSLVGMAIATMDGSGASTSAVENCAVSGYKISVSKGNQDCSVGGLVGASNAEITHCTAVTDIDVLGLSNNSNIRIGGLVGASRAMVEYCYSGGTLNINGGTHIGVWYDPIPTPILGIGGIVGGRSMREFQTNGGSGTPTLERVVDDTNLDLISCYTYEITNVTGDHDRTGTRYYAVGGDASSGNVTYKKCFYMDWKKGLTYQDALPANNVEAKDYKGLTKEAVDDFLAELNDLTYTGNQFIYLSNDGGVHSYPTSAHLENMDYPFPAILTGAAEEAETQYVHYGDWPLDGIIRDDGGTPIAIDILADYKAPDTGATTEPEKSGGAFEKITLSLSSLLQQSLSSAGSDPLGELTVSIEPVEAAGGEGESGGSAGGTTGGASGTGGSTGGSEGGTSETNVVEAYFLDTDNTKKEAIDLTSDNLNSDFRLDLVILAKNPGSVNVVVVCQKPAAAGGAGEVISTLTIPVTVTAVVKLFPARLNGHEIVSDTVTPQVILLGADAASGSGTPGMSGASGTTGNPDTGEEEIVSTIALYPFDKNGKSLPENLLSQIELEGSAEIVSAAAAASLNEFPLNTISANAAIGNEEMGAALDEEAAVTDHLELKVSGKMDGLTLETSSIKVNYSYTYLEKTYNAETEIPVSVKEAQLTAAPANIVLESVDVSGGDVLPSAESVSYRTEHLNLTLNGASEAVTDPRIVSVESVKVELETAGSGTTEPGTTEPGTTESENTGSGNEGSGSTGSEDTGSGNDGSGNTGSGTTEPGTTESENTGSGNTESKNEGTKSGDSEFGTCVKAEPQVDGTLMLTPQKCGTETLKLVVEFTYDGNKYRMSTDLVVTVSAAVQAANLEVSGGDLLISGEVSGGDPVVSGISALANVFKSEPTVRKPVDGVRYDEDGLLPSPFKSAQDVSDGDLE